MDILVCIKQVPSTSEVKIDQKTGSLIRDGIDSKMNPYDLYALETAMRIKQETGAKITVLSMGPPQVKEIIQEAFMMGADEGVVLTDRRLAGADCLATAYALSQSIEKIGLPDLIICGKQTTDGDTAQVGPEMAEFLGIPHITNVVALGAVSDDNLIVSADLPGMIQTAEIRFPALITVEKDIFQPRLPSYRRKLETAGKDVKFYSLNDLADQDESKYGLTGSPTQVVRIFPPENHQESRIYEGLADQLANQLFDALAEWKFM
jgi:electron transfer flavoprotein beta subunit